MYYNKSYGKLTISKVRLMAVTNTVLLYQSLKHPTNYQKFKQLMQQYGS